MPDDDVKALLDRYHPVKAETQADPVASLLDRFHPVATVEAPKATGPALTFADGSPVPVEGPTLDDRIGTEKSSGEPESYGAFRTDERDPMFAAERHNERVRSEKAKRINDRGPILGALERSADAVGSAVLSAAGRLEEVGTGLGETIGTYMGGSAPTATDKDRIYRKVEEAGRPWRETIDEFKRKDPGNVRNIEGAETAGRMATDLGVMALPGGAGVHGAKGFALGSVMLDPTNPAEAAASGALAYAGMKAGGAALAKPVAAIMERVASKWTPEMAAAIGKSLIGVAEGAGMAAAPHVTEDGLHSALLGAIQGNPDDRIAAATNIAIVAAFRALGRQVPTEIAEAYIRGNFARVPATIRPLLDTVAMPIIRAGAEVREAELRADRPARTAIEIDRIREAEAAKSRPTVEPPDQDAAALRTALQNPEFIRDSVGLDAARRREAFQQEGAKDRRLQESMKDTTERLINNGFGQSDTSIPLTTLIRERFGVSADRAKTVIDDLYRDGVIEPDLHRREVGADYKRVESLRSDVYTAEDAAAASQRASERLSGRSGGRVGADPVMESRPDIEADSPSGVRPQRADKGALILPEGMGATGGLMMNQGLVTKAAKGAVGAARDQIASFIDRVRAKGTPTSREMADAAEKVVDETKRLTGTAPDALGTQRDVALQAAGGRPGTEAGEAARRLSTPVEVPGQDYAFSALEQGVAGRKFQPNAPDPTPAEQKIIDAIRDVVNQRGKVYEGVGLKQYDGGTGEWHDFVNIEGGRVFPHVSTPDGLDAIHKGPSSPVFRKMVDAFAHANKIPREAVEADFIARHEASVSDIPGTGASSTQAEFRRQYQKFPSAVKINGEWVEIFETNPSNYVRRLVDTGASRAAVVKVLGQDVPVSKPISGGETDVVMSPGAVAPDVPAKPTLASRAKQARSEGWGDDFAGMVRGLHGNAIRPPLIEPGSKTGAAARVANTLLKVVKALNLSGTAATNIPEFTGNISSLAGRSEAWKATAQMLTRAKAWKMDVEAVETLGAVTRDFLNMSWDPTHPLQSGVRMFTDFMKRATLHGPVNESQEYTSAVVALRMARRFQAGGGKPIDVQRLMGTGLDPALAKRLVSGQGTQADYDAFVRRMPGQTVGANLSPVEKSNVEANRLSKLTAFSHYAWMSARSAANQSRAFLVGMKQAATDPILTRAQRYKKAFDSAASLTTWAANKTIQGTLQAFLLAYLTEGKEGVAVKWNEMKDRPLQFARDSFLYTTVGGPLGVVARAASGDKSADLANIVYPYFALKEVIGASFGVGERYAGRDTADRWSEWMKRNTPIYRSVENGLVAVGLGSEQAKDIDTARRAFYRWKYDVARKGSGSWTPPSDEEVNRYRAEIRKAADLFSSGATPEEVREHVDKALGVTGKKPDDVRKSILRRRLLTKDVLERADELKSRIGEDAFKMLRLHDELLTRLARTVQGGR